MLKIYKTLLIYACVCVYASTNIEDYFALCISGTEFYQNVVLSHALYLYYTKLNQQMILMSTVKLVELYLVGCEYQYLGSTAIIFWWKPSNEQGHLSLPICV